MAKIYEGFTKKNVENIVEEIELQDPQINPFQEEKEEKFDIYQWIKGIDKLERFHFFNPFKKKLLSNLELTILMTEKTLLKDSIIFPSMNEYFLYDPNQGIYLKYDEVGYRIIIGGILDKFSITPDFRQVSTICNNFKVGKKSKTNNVHTNLKNDMICFTNCVLNLSTRISEPHSPNYFLITRLEFEYQPENKSTPNFTNYINSLCDNFADRVTLLRSWFWLLIYNETSTQTFLYMLGRGRTGKSIFGHICTALVGKEGSVVTSLKSLNTDPFEVYNLKDRLLIIVSDTEHYRGDLAVLKQVVSGDPLKARVKFMQGSYDIYPRGLVLIIGNHGLGSQDSSGAIERRLRLFIADNVIDVKDTKPLLYNHQGRWKGLLSTELPGIFNWIYNFSQKEAISYMENTMDFVPSLKTDYLDNQVQLNPMKNWVEEELEQGKGAFLGFHTKDDDKTQMEDQKRGLLIPAYVRYCKKRNINPITHVRFSRELLSTCKTLKLVATKQRLKEGIYIKGIQLKKDIFDRDQIFGGRELIVENNVENNLYIWVMDETYFSDKVVLLLVISLKTTAIIGSCCAKSTEEDQKAYIYSTDIEQVYRDIIDAGHNVPKYVHTDQKFEYQKENILTFFEEYQIAPSIAGKNENQVVESINHQIKTLIIRIIFEIYKRNSYFMAFLALLPEQFKSLTLTEKSKDKSFRDLLFKSDFFQQYVDINTVFQEAIDRFNAKKSQVSATNLARITLTKLNNIILTPKHLIQGTKKSPIGQLIQTFNDSGYLAAATQIKDIITQDQQPEMKMINDLVVLDHSHVPTTQQHIMNALIYIACQNQLQIDQMGVNKQMMIEQSDKIEELLKTNLNLSEQLKILTTEQERQQQALQQKEMARQKRLNRQIKPETQPFTRQMVEELIDEIRGGSFIKARLRCAFTLLTITGIRCEELRRLKVKQIHSLLSNNYCPITRQKRGPANLKAFLRDYGISMLKQRKNDFEILIARKNECFDENDQDKRHSIIQECYIFSSENKPQTPLSRAFFNNMLNKTLLSFANKRKMQTIYTTHSFRHDFITELWRDSNDIEFVRQFMGHKKIQSTVAYIQDLPESERLVKLLEIDRAKANKSQQN